MQRPADNLEEGQRGEDSDATVGTGSMNRRRFVKRILAVTGGLVAWRFGGGDAAARVLPSASSAPSVAGASRGISLPGRYQGYPAPRYAPPGFNLVEIYTNRPDGFGLTSEEVAYWYINARSSFGFNNPLSIFVARTPQRATLATTEQHPGIPMVLSSASGESIQAIYHDGFWVLASPASQQVRWDTTNVHSLSFKLKDFQITVRGSRFAGCTIDELMRTASSIN